MKRSGSLGMQTAMGSAIVLPMIVVLVMKLQMIVLDLQTLDGGADGEMANDGEIANGC